MSMYIHSYVRNRKNELVGCVAAIAHNTVGWSLCNTAAGDIFDKQMALEIAIGRAMNGFNTDIPHTVVKEYEKMIDRSKKYFKIDRFIDL